MFSLSATLGEPCQVSVGCQTITAGGQAINSECLSGVCSCPSADFYTLNGQCLPSMFICVSCKSSSGGSRGRSGGLL